ncbi:hypothetical protein RP20_CCG028220 [Aedes albopictus]|nr:hypothetical protein RP20_CCG028220 [Aedes albopictus]
MKIFRSETLDHYVVVVVEIPVKINQQKTVQNCRKSVRFYVPEKVNGIFYGIEVILVPGVGRYLGTRCLRSGGCVVPSSSPWKVCAISPSSVSSGYDGSKKEERLPIPN